MIFSLLFSRKILLLCFVFLMNYIIVGQKNNFYNTDSSLVFIEAGKFRIGNRKGENDEKPVHKVKISAFYISKYEITNAEFVEFLNSKGNRIENNSLWIDTKGRWNNIKCRIIEREKSFFVESGYESYPVNFVSWYGANAYCKWKCGRLPTEAEWEYAAKNNSKNINKYAWCKSNSNQNLSAIGQKMPNERGIYDMQGNLWEWCVDWYNAEYYKKKERKNPKCTKKADFKVLKGGSWANKKPMLRVSNRNARNPNSNRVNIGFRIVYDYQK